MAITYLGTGAVVASIGGSLTPSTVSYQTGDALIYITGEHPGTDAQTTPAGWNQLSLNSTETVVTIWGRIAQSSTETIPSVTWPASSRGYAMLSAFRGVDPSFTSLYAGTPERLANTTGNIVGPPGARTPTGDGALIILAGIFNKTATSDGSVYTAPSGWDGMLNYLVTNGSSNASSFAAAYWVQPTATTIPANTPISGTIVDTSSTMRSTSIALAPAASSGGGGGNTGTVAFPPFKRKTYVYIDNYYPR